eukprot:1160422-Pelagomonas_calceolata.AAC.4
MVRYLPVRAQRVQGALSLQVALQHAYTAIACLDAGPSLWASCTTKPYRAAAAKPWPIGSLPCVYQYQPKKCAGGGISGQHGVA